MMFDYIILFVLFSFIGWCIDSIYTSATDKQWTFAGWLRIPLCPIYGFGGLTLISLISLFSELPITYQAIIYCTALTAIEYAGAVFSEKVLNAKLWDYSGMPLNFQGRISALHSTYWLIISLLLERFAYEHVTTLADFLTAPPYIEYIFVSLFLLLSVWLVARRITKTRIEQINANLKTLGSQIKASELNRIKKILNYKIILKKQK